MMTKRLYLFSVWVAAGLALITILVAPRHLCGQTINGRIVGTVTDPSQAAVPGANVTAVDVNTNEARKTITNSTGDYVISALRVGDYRVSVELAGFSTAIRPVSITSDTPMRADFQLVVGKASTQVTVADTAPVLQTESSDVRKGVGVQELTELPVISRLGEMTPFDQFLFILPGAIRALNVLPVINGVLSPSALTYTVDGIISDDIADTWGFAGSPSQDAVQTIEVKLNAASAEYGSAMTMMQLVTKSGGNVVHGSVYEFNRNSAAEARNPFNNLVPAFDNRNEFGGTIGGPIRKDKMFFFAWAEGLKDVGGQQLSSTVPTDREKAGDFSQTTWPGTTGVVVPGFPAYQNGQVIPIYDPLTQQPFPGNVIPPDRIAKAAKVIQALYPGPNQPSHTTTFNYLGNPGAHSGVGHFGGRVDNRFSASDTLMGSFVVSNSWPATRYY